MERYRRLRRNWIRLALALILVVGAGLRLYNVNWDASNHVHPDERWISIVATDISWPDDLSTALQPHQTTLNPFYEASSGESRNFAYGHLPLYLVRGVAGGLRQLAPPVERVGDSPRVGELASNLRQMVDYDRINLVGRVLSALFDTVTVALVFLLGRLLYDRRVALLGAAFVALTVLHIQLSHFYAFDVVMVTFIVAAIYFMVRVAQEGGWRNSFFAGIFTGLAVSAKFTAAPLLISLGTAHLLRFLGVGRGERVPSSLKMDPIAGASEDVASVGPSSGNPGAAAVLDLPGLGELSWDPVLVNRILRDLVLSVLAALLAFAVTSPFSILDIERYVASLTEQSKMVRGAVDFPYTRQYRRTIPYWYHIKNQVLWGTGVPLGVMGFIGFAYFIVRVVRRRTAWAEVVLFAWTVPYFLITGSFMVKFMRYMLLLTPFLALMAAYLLFAIKGWLADRYGGRGRRGGFALVGVVLLGTALWVAAFMNVYAQPLTRVEASQWIYRNIPPDSAITSEAWDDALPFGMTVDGEPRRRGEYRDVNMNLYEAPGEDKFQHVVQSLREADYVIITSKRLWGWLPRLQDRYPLADRYYELLFAEKLGFQRVATFTNYPRLDGLVFNDDAADESFTVYDHPKVMIFEKVRQVSEAEFRQLFADALAQAGQGEVERAQAREEQEARPSLLLDRPVDELPVVDERGWNPVANAHPLISVVSWWLLLQILGLVAFPLTFTVFRNFGDRGYLFSKGLGLLIVAYLVWIAASLRLVMNTVWTALLAVVILAGLSYLLFRRHRSAILAFWQGKRRLIAWGEGLFALAFLLFVGIRLLNPDLWQPWLGGEKHMEFAFLNATLRTPYFPPYDPYYAGGYINYYYYGIYLMGVLIKLTGIAPQVGFNLAIPTLFALTVTGAYSLALNLVDPMRSKDNEAPGPGDDGRMNRGGALVNSSSRQLVNSFPRHLIPLLAGFFVAVAGNVDGMRQVLEGLAQISSTDFQSAIPGLGTAVRAATGLPRLLLTGASFPGFDYWRSTRVIPFTINEFPFFSFLFADLHPHMIGIPFTVLVLALALNVVKDARRRGGDAWWPASRFEYITSNLPVLLSPWNVLSTLLTALALGAVAAINTWDLPTYLGIVVVAVVLQQSLVNRRLQIVPALLAALPVAVLSLLLYLPFFRFYKALHVGIGLVRDKTSLEPFLTIWILFLFLVASYLVIALLRRWDGLAPLRLLRLLARRWETLPHLLELHGALVRDAGPAYLSGLYGFIVALLVAAGLAITGRWVMAVLVLPLYVAGLLFLRSNATPEEHFTNLLVFTGLAILLGTEIIFLRDFLGGGDHYRMNTLFKFYIQVWVLFGTAGAVALPAIWNYLRERTSVPGRAIWAVVFAVLLLSVSVYPVLGTVARVNDRFPGERPAIGTLSGMAYMRVGSYTWPDDNRIELQYDYRAIHWLVDHVDGTPVVAEAVLPYYREGGLRVASYTGLPTLLGAHQGEQRYDWQVGQRDGRASTFFNTPDASRAWELIRELNISYVYLGQLERAVYDPAGLEKFERMREAGDLELVYQNPEVKIYRVVEEKLAKR